MLSSRRWRAVPVLIAVVVAVACDGTSPRTPTAAGTIAVGTQRFTVTRDPAHICLAGPAGRPRCLSSISALSEPVVAALLEAEGPDHEIVLILTRRDVAVVGLGADAVRSVVAPAGDGDALALWVDLRAARQGPVCVHYRRPDGASGTVVVHRSMALGGDGGVAEAPAAGCG